MKCNKHLIKIKSDLFNQVVRPVKSISVQEKAHSTIEWTFYPNLCKTLKDALLQLKKKKLCNPIPYKAASRRNARP